MVMVVNGRAPTIYIIPPLGPKVYKYDLLWAIWSPRGSACRIHVSWISKNCHSSVQVSRLVYSSVQVPANTLLIRDFHSATCAVQTKGTRKANMGDFWFQAWACQRAIHPTIQPGPSSHCCDPAERAVGKPKHIQVSNCQLSLSVVFDLVLQTAPDPEQGSVPDQLRVTRSRCNLTQSSGPRKDMSDQWTGKLRPANKLLATITEVYAILGP